MSRTGGTSGEAQSTASTTTGHGGVWAGRTIITSSAVSGALAGKSGIGNGPASSGTSSGNTSSGGGQSAAAHGGFGAAGAHASSSGS